MCWHSWSLSHGLEIEVHLRVWTICFLVFLKWYSMNNLLLWIVHSWCLLWNLALTMTVWMMLFVSTPDSQEQTPAQTWQVQTERCKSHCLKVDNCLTCLTLPLLLCVKSSHSKSSLKIPDCLLICNLDYVWNGPPVYWFWCRDIWKKLLWKIQQQLKSSTTFLKKIWKKELHIASRKMGDCQRETSSLSALP